MIKIAAGEKLSLTQDDIGINGWAMEARVYAEDPLRKFLPQIGKLVRYNEPADPENKQLRVDSGILEGSEISVYYDPMVAKVITRMRATSLISDGFRRQHQRRSHCYFERCSGLVRRSWCYP